LKKNLVVASAGKRSKKSKSAISSAGKRAQGLPLHNDSEQNRDRSAPRTLIHLKMKGDYAQRLIPNETAQSAPMIALPIHGFFAFLPIAMPPASVKMTKLGVWLMPTSDCV